MDGKTMIRYLGHSAFQIAAVDGARIVIDPYSNDEWPNQPRPFPEDVVADVVLITHEHIDHNSTFNVKGDFKVVRTTGTHEVGKKHFYFVPSRHGEGGGFGVNYLNNIISFRLDGMIFCHLGDLGTVLSEEQINYTIKPIDFLMVPVGARDHALSLKDVDRVVDQLRPKVVFPIHYKMAGASRENVDLEPVETWVGSKRNVVRRSTDRVFVSKSDLPTEREIWILEMA
jgi:L-ascorbate metabolism protein UlaG (beta-lactamase superfamily)